MIKTVFPKNPSVGDLVFCKGIMYVFLGTEWVETDDGISRRLLISEMLEDCKKLDDILFNS